MQLTVLGIRHHGVGSAINTLERLKEIKPDHIIVEGPLELMQSLEGVDLSTLKPPLAILAYNPKVLSDSYFYPYAEFSPEWQTFKFAKKQGISLTMADMPLKHLFALKKEQDEVEDKEEVKYPLPLHNDPLEEMAKLEGYESSDVWWEKHFEQDYYSDATAHFEAVLMVMGALREHYVNHDFEENNHREAFMREAIRTAKEEGKKSIVFVCGAWHAPALLEYEAHKKKDKKLISKLPKMTVETSWIPWTNSRLSWKSGYGAGIDSPGWYEHLWKEKKDDGKKWLIEVAKVFRKNDIDISTAHVIEAYHLALTLAKMRGFRRAGLAEFDEAIISVMCMGDEILLKFIKEELTIGKKMGKIPSDLPKLPIEKDFESKTKTYRFPLREDDKQYQLDLRTSRGLEKSTFLHRLKILDIEWAEELSSRSKGTFKELWNLAWQPSLALQIIDKGLWGNTIEIASKNYVNARAKKSNNVEEVINLLEQSIVAKLFNSVDFIITKIDDLTTQRYEVTVLMESVIPLIKIARYSDVRQTDEAGLKLLIDALLRRIMSSLTMACYGLNPDTALKMFELITELNESMVIFDDEALIKNWFACLEQVSVVEDVAFLIQGSVYRILLDAKVYESEMVEKGLAKALSVGEEPINSTYWVQGFLKGSATILLLDAVAWNILYLWMDSLDEETFDSLLPLLRRTFSKFSAHDRAKIGTKAKEGIDTNQTFEAEDITLLNFDQSKALKALMLTKERLYGK